MHKVAWIADSERRIDAFETDKLGEQDTIQVRVGQALRAEASEFETTKAGVRSEVPFLLCRKSRLI